MSLPTCLRFNRKSLQREVVRSEFQRRLKGFLLILRQIRIHKRLLHARHGLVYRLHVVEFRRSSSRYVDELRVLAAL